MLDFLRSPKPVLLGVALLCSLASAARAEPVLSVERVSGAARIDRLGETRLLKVGDELRDRDVLRLADDARLSLRFAREGTVELGQGAALAIERLPASDAVTDLRSIFSLWKGYLHIVWKRPPPPAIWPLYVYFGGRRSSLVEGEYFFERDGERTRSCVAYGRLTVSPISGDGVETFRPSACYELPVGKAPKIAIRDPASWAAVREEFTINPAPAAQRLAAAAAVRAMPPAPLAAKLSLALTPPSRAAAAIPDPASLAGSGWTVVVGSFADAANAAQLQQKLIAAGYEPFIRVKIIDGKTWNSVQLRSLPTREAAVAKAATLQARLGLPELRIVPLP